MCPNIRLKEERFWLLKISPKECSWNQTDYLPVYIVKAVYWGFSRVAVRQPPEFAAMLRRAVVGYQLSNGLNFLVKTVRVFSEHHGYAFRN